jgi:hypothetical protein
VSSTRSGLFEHRGGGARYSSLSTLDGRAVYNCHLATHGARVSIDFAEVPTAMGKADVLEIAASIPEGRLCTFKSARAVT